MTTWQSLFCLAKINVLLTPTCTCFIDAEWHIHTTSVMGLHHTFLTTHTQLTAIYSKFTSISTSIIILLTCKKILHLHLWTKKPHTHILSQILRWENTNSVRTHSCQLNDLNGRLWAKTRKKRKKKPVTLFWPNETIQQKIEMIAQ